MVGPDIAMCNNTHCAEQCYAQRQNLSRSGFLARAAQDAMATKATR